jgi:beta-glucosidase
MDGEEVVELYISYPGLNGQAPVRALKGFQRVSLKAGEKKIVSFRLTPEDLSIIDNNGNPQQVKGNVLISVGGSQPDATSITNKKVVQATIKVSPAK